MLSSQVGWPPSRHAARCARLAARRALPLLSMLPADGLQNGFSRVENRPRPARINSPRRTSQKASDPPRPGFPDAAVPWPGWSAFRQFVDVFQHFTRQNFHIGQKYNIFSDTIVPMVGLLGLDDSSRSVGLTIILRLLFQLLISLFSREGGETPTLPALALRCSLPSPARRSLSQRSPFLFSGRPPLSFIGSGTPSFCSLGWRRS